MFLICCYDDGLWFLYSDLNLFRSCCYVSVGEKVGGFGSVWIGGYYCVYVWEYCCCGFGLCIFFSSDYFISGNIGWCGFEVYLIRYDAVCSRYIRDSNGWRYLFIMRYWYWFFCNLNIFWIWNVFGLWFFCLVCISCLVYNNIFSRFFRFMKRYLYIFIIDILFFGIFIWNKSKFLNFSWSWFCWSRLVNNLDICIFVYSGYFFR